MTRLQITNINNYLFLNYFENIIYVLRKYKVPEKHGGSLRMRTKNVQLLKGLF